MKMRRCFTIESLEFSTKKSQLLWQVTQEFFWHMHYLFIIWFCISHAPIHLQHSLSMAYGWLPGSLSFKPDQFNCSSPSHLGALAGRSSGSQVSVFHITCHLKTFKWRCQGLTLLPSTHKARSLSPSRCPEPLYPFSIVIHLSSDGKRALHFPTLISKRNKTEI